MNMSIDEIVDNFGVFDDWEGRYEYLIGLGKTLPPMDDALKTESSRVQGCMSDVWIVLYWGNDRRLNFIADSNAEIPRGLIAILYAAYAGKTMEEVTTVDIDAIFQKIGLDRHLANIRRNGFFSMVEYIRAFISRRI